MKSFKNIKRTSIGVAFGMILLILNACKKDETKELGTAPTSDMVQFTATPTASNANVIEFKNLSPGNKAIWDFGNGANAQGNTVQASYPLEGSYTVKLTILTENGYAINTKTVVIARTNPAMLNDPAFVLLSGGLSNTAGKTWVIDQTQQGHLGVGPATGTTPEWYQAGPNEKNGLGFYDDEMTFNMNALQYTYANNGNTFANAANAPGIGGPAGSSDPTVNYTPPTGMTWMISKIDNVDYITISKNGFIGYYLGVSQYKILSLTNDEMWLRSADKAVAGNAWYIKLIRKGFTRPVTPPVQKPLQAANIEDDFQSSTTLTWTAENMDYVRPYDNPSKFPINTSAKVGYYEKRTGDEGQYGNLNMTMPYRFDLSTKNKIKLKVFFPSANDFSKVGSKVSIKLQNSLLGGNAWQTQLEVAKVITPAQYDKWIQLEFDYSGWASQTLYDKIVVQLGGEGHPDPGIFFIDDFQFK